MKNWFNWLKRKKSVVTPDDVLDDDPLVRECISKCFNTGETVFITNIREGEQSNEDKKI